MVSKVVANRNAALRPRQAVVLIQSFIRKSTRRRTFIQDFKNCSRICYLHWHPSSALLVNISTSALPVSVSTCISFGFHRVSLAGRKKNISGELHEMTHARLRKLPINFIHLCPITVNENESRANPNLLDWCAAAPNLPAPRN